MGRIFILLLMGLTLGGCFNSHGPDVSTDWPSRPTAVANIDRPAGKGVLQVFAGYTPPVYSHAALRVETPDGHVVFWDPGGDYAKTATTGRQGDNPTRPPTAAEYLRWRLDVVGDRGGEVFEWDVTAEEAAYLADVLENGRTSDDPEGSFDPDVPPSQCALTICEYLDRFAPQYVQLGERLFYPYSLAQALYKQNPDRIIVYWLNKPTRVYYRPNR